jgi:hypothetical protein
VQGRFPLTRRRPVAPHHVDVEPGLAQRIRRNLRLVADPRNILGRDEHQLLALVAAGRQQLPRLGEILLESLRTGLGPIRPAADEEAVAGEDAAVLAEMLLKAHYHSNSLSVGQSFFYSSIKRRIIMLTSSKKVSYSYVRRILVLPVALAIVALLSFTIKDQLDQNQLTEESIVQSQLDSIPAKYRDPKTGKIKGSFQIDIDGDIAIFKDVKTKKKLFEVPLNELGGNKPADRIELVLANTMGSGLPMDNSSKFIFISDSSAGGKQIKEEKKFIVITDGNATLDTVLLMKEGFPIPPIPPVPPVSPVAPGKPVIIINGKEVSPADLKRVYDNNPALKYNINDESAGPGIIDAVIGGELNFSQYPNNVKLKLLKKSIE